MSNIEFIYFNYKKGSRLVLSDSSSFNSFQSELLKQQEESRREIEREKAKYQRELEEMKQKLSKLMTAPSLPLEVN